ncbi:MAG: hypothetical protein WA055_03710 [Candidatus Moraniibacteriota bacterium]
MQQKTKITILIGLITIAILAVAVYMFKKSAFFNPSLKQKKQTQQEPEKIPEQKMEESTQPSVITTIQADGVVSQVSKDSLEITNDETKNTFILKENISVILVNGAKLEKKKISDIKKNQNVSLMINQADSQIISIQILQKVTEDQVIF